MTQELFDAVQKVNDIAYKLRQDGKEVSFSLDVVHLLYTDGISTGYHGLPANWYSPQTISVTIRDKPKYSQCSECGTWQQERTPE
jgi:hypothetical protein